MGCLKITYWNEAEMLVAHSGSRVRKVVERGAIKEERLYLGDYEVFRKTVSGTLDTERETLHISDDTGRIALVDTETTTENSQTIRYQLSNHLGSATLELDGSANLISYEEYHPFGSTSYRSGRSAAEVSLKRYRYVGKERDEETGLYYYGARYYAGWLGRFVSVDPLKDEYPYYTSYQYAGNKPITFIDLDGLEETLPEHARGTFDAETRKYTVEGGGGELGFDTLFSIAERFGTTVDALKQVNNLSNEDIKAGQTLIIPEILSQNRIKEILEFVEGLYSAQSINVDPRINDLKSSINESIFLLRYNADFADRNLDFEQNWINDALQIQSELSNILNESSISVDKLEDLKSRVKSISSKSTTDVKTKMFAIQFEEGLGEIGGQLFSINAWQLANNELSKRLKGKDLLGFDSMITESTAELQSILRQIETNPRLSGELDKFGLGSYFKSIGKHAKAIKLWAPKKSAIAKESQKIIETLSGYGF